MIVWGPLKGNIFAIVSIIASSFSVTVSISAIVSSFSALFMLSDDNNKIFTKHTDVNCLPTSSVHVHFLSLNVYIIKILTTHALLPVNVFRRLLMASDDDKIRMAMIYDYSKIILIYIKSYKYCFRNVYKVA